MPKSTESTVFVKFVPTPTKRVQRHQLEEIFSNIGPIKKTSWIHSEENKSKGYGFIKYLSSDDAKTASSSLNGTKIQMDEIEYQILVEVASLEKQQARNLQHHDAASAAKTTVESSNLEGKMLEDSLKKKSRVILRNLSFYAKDNHIRSVLEKKFGNVSDVHLPRVQSNLHVGFCFVTFANPDDARRAVEAGGVDIQKRTVSISWSIPKSMHQRLTPSSGNRNNEPVQNDQKSNLNEFDVDVEDNDEKEDVDETSLPPEESESEFIDGRTVFLRNLPFDATRKDLFELFATFGYIESIYLVKDKITGMLKGTAFITYKRGTSANAAVSAGSPSAATGDIILSTAKQLKRDSPSSLTETEGPPLVLKGRSLMVNMAVDKETARTLDSKAEIAPSADRRNLYLQAEARVESTPTEPGMKTSNTWDEIPEQDQKKRQSALKDKTTKLQSPIFFINPNRLSIRNLAKHVDESQLRTLCENATKRGLQSGLVGAKDYMAHIRAQGDLSAKEIKETGPERGRTTEDVFSPWDDKKKGKEYIPSVYVDRDYNSGGTKTKGISRGFGFVEFTHHVHALACLRELNNNPSYSNQYAAGGKQVIDRKKNGRKPVLKGSNGREIRIPRLIVDFTVENRVKAKKQSERRLHQKLNNKKQRLEATDSKLRTIESTKRGRGAAQRARKRQKITCDPTEEVSKEKEEHHQKLEGPCVFPSSKSRHSRISSRAQSIRSDEESCQREMNERKRHHPNDIKSGSEADTSMSGEKVEKKGARWFE